ncbi:Peroxidase 7 [Abeliophyllum distichum]|uniref:Peroxidase n=1 Tax=Abeliophyllum distichum TaxID=126358 RepID=A0ABD1UI39_9LAMI
MRWWCCVFGFVLTLHLDIIAAKSAAQPPPNAIKNKPRTMPTTRPAADHLSTAYYANSCPNLEAIINQKGCDASILLNYPGSERRAHASKTLRGFALIDEIKAEVERRCPRTVSCSDILTAAARDATVFAGGPFWQVPFGRKDGRVSLAKEADTVPQGHENITSLLDLFQKLGLNIVDLVVLSGSHTIGRSTCSSIQQRFSNFNGTGKPDPSIDFNYLNSLRRQCKLSTNFVNLDGTTPRTFDVAYYTNLEKKMGLLSTDQLLHSDSRTSPIVDALASQAQLFTSQFAVSMVKLGNVQVFTGKTQGEIRRNCNFVNS